ncbi:peroxiredoxin [Chitinophaga sp. S165]|uniref:peroxiredoxin family protein n=1 Tax=Chitinophaga sp. S165 TaxID=2135462 RepID=UPI000D710A24|nr:TlpA disulfide reductase family protein [Chitinophaga sp. S165]PWV56965.1 peroxiredoxin [Chitinophaga sp. S165]
MRKFTFFMLSTLLLTSNVFDLRASVPATGISKFWIIRPTLNNRPDKTLRDDTTFLNKPAPDFKLYDLNGKLYDTEFLKGKIVVLNFWFVACKPCINEMPVLNAIKKKHDPEKIVFLALSLDNKSTINTFLKEHEFDYNILPDAAPVAEKYGLFAYPASVVIDSRGIVRFMQVGGPNIDKNLSNAIDAVL